MSRGRHNPRNAQRGFSSQNWAALSLFLQHLQDPNFAYVQIEPDHSEDFDLVFKDGRRVVCESKDRQGNFSYSDLRGLLKKILDKGGLGARDEVLVVCRKVARNFVGEVERSRYGQEFCGAFVQKGFTAEEVALLPRVKFWVVADDFNRAEINQSLMASLIGFWVTPGALERFTDFVLVRGIYENARIGEVYSRESFQAAVEKFREEAVEESDAFREGQKDLVGQLTKIERDIAKGKVDAWGTGSISALTARWQLMSFAIDRYRSKENCLNLSKHAKLWRTGRGKNWSSIIFDVFGRNLHTEENVDYALRFLSEDVDGTRFAYRSDFYNVGVARLVAGVIGSAYGTERLGVCLEILSKLISHGGRKRLFLWREPHGHGIWESGQVIKVLRKIFDFSEDSIRDDVVDLLFSSFNLIEDDGELSHHVPSEVFDIIRCWLSEDTEGRFDKFVGVVIGQYDSFYRRFGKNYMFDGAERFGGGVGFCGGYHVSNHHFVSRVLAPALAGLYEIDQDAGWRFMLDNCVTPDKRISHDRPDFLNRAVYEIVLQRYGADDDAVSDEAFAILKGFILSRHGMPSKLDLVFSSLVGASMSEENKWRLVEVYLGKYTSYKNPFVEQITTRLAEIGHREAAHQLRVWFADPEYLLSRGSALSMEDAVAAVGSLGDKDLELAKGLFRQLMNSPQVAEDKGGGFGGFAMANQLREFLKKDYEWGIGVIKELLDLDEMSRTQQSIFSQCLIEQGADDSDDKELLLKLYDDVVSPLFGELDDDIQKIVAVFPSVAARESLVQFAVRLAVQGCTSESLRMIRVLVDDPDPVTFSCKTASESDYPSEHERIESGERPQNLSSIRGWCGWALMKCAGPKGRDNLSEIVGLTERLILDDNYFVVHMACMALHQLAVNRLAVTRENRQVMFFGYDKKCALLLAKRVETIALELLERFSSWPDKVRVAMSKSVLEVFGAIRSLGEKDALRLFEVMASLPSDAMEHTPYLFIYYSEFRKNAFLNWSFVMSGLYDDLGPENYDEDKPRAICEDTIKRLSVSSPGSLFRFVTNVGQLLRDTFDETGKNAMPELALKYLGLITEHYDHNVFVQTYRIIAERINVDDAYRDRWFDLFVRCLTVEKKYLEAAVGDGRLDDVRWYVSTFQSEVIDVILRDFPARFMDVARVFFSYPSGVALHESGDMLAEIKRLSVEEDGDAAAIVQKLFNDDPARYYFLKSDKL
jgi:hypothetical protein